MKNLRTLVLNNSYMPLSLFPLYTIPAEEALQRWSRNNCTIVASYDRKVLTQQYDDLYWPSVIANHNGHSFKKEIALSPESLYYRDHCICQYCGTPLTISSMTYDHVVPTSKDGTHSWDNIVASCHECNNLKGNSTSPYWKPKQKPWTPTFYEMIEIRKRWPIVVDDEQWKLFLPNWAADVIVRK